MPEVDMEIRRAKRYIHASVDERIRLHISYMAVKDRLVNKNLRVFGQSWDKTQEDRRYGRWKLVDGSTNPQIHYTWRSRKDFEQSVGLNEKDTLIPNSRSSADRVYPLPA